MNQQVMVIEQRRPPSIKDQTIAVGGDSLSAMISPRRLNAFSLKAASRQRALAIGAAADVREQTRHAADAVEAIREWNEYAFATRRAGGGSILRWCVVSSIASGPGFERGS